MPHPACAGLDEADTVVRDESRGNAAPVPRYLAVVGFKTLSFGGEDEGWLGIGLGEELATRLSMAGNVIRSVERLQLSEILVTCAATPGLATTQATPHSAFGDESPELDKACAATLRQATALGTLQGADLLLLGTLLRDEQTLRATTRLVDVRTGALQSAVTAQVPCAGGSIGGVRALAATLAAQWCQKLGVPFVDEMRDASVEQASVYQALWQARQSLYEGSYEQCLAAIAWAEAQLPDARQLECLLSTRDEAWGQQLAQCSPNGPEVQRIVGQMLQSAQHTKDYYKQSLAMCCYYTGRAYEKAGRLGEAEAEYRECLAQRPSRLLWEFEAGCAIDDPLIVDGIAYAGFEDGHVRAFNARSGQMLWDFAGDTTTLIGTPLPGVVPVEAVPVIPFEVEDVVESVAYVRSCSHLYAFRSVDGLLIWQFSNGCTLDEPVIDRGVVYISSHDLTGTGGIGGFVDALDARTGRELWHKHFPQDIQSPRLADGFLWAGSQDGHVRALDVTDGRVWCDFNIEVVSGKGSWVASADPDAGRLYVKIGSKWNTPLQLREGDSLCAIDARDGGVHWRHETPTTMGQAEIVGGMVYITETGTCSQEARAARLAQRLVRCLDADTGVLLWTFDAIAEIEPPTVYDGAILISSADGRIRFLNAITGMTLWGARAGNSMPIARISNGVVYAASDDGYLQALRVDDGGLLWRTRTEGRCASNMLVTPVAVYLQTQADLISFNIGTGEQVCDLPGYWGVDSIVDDVVYASGSDGYLRAVEPGPRLGPDYAELATARLMRCLEARGRSAEAARFGARLFRQTEQRSTELRDAYPAKAVSAGLPRALRPVLYAALGDQTEVVPPIEPLWSLGGWEEITQITAAGDTVFARANDGQLRAINGVTGTLEWQCRTDGAIDIDTITLAQGRVYVLGASGDPHLWAIDASTGKMVWEREANGCFGQLVVGDGMVCVTDSRARETMSLQALDAETGKLQWAWGADDLYIAAIANGAAYLTRRSATGKDYVQAVDVRSGDEIWRYSIDGSRSSLIVIDGCLYVAELQYYPRMRSRLLAINARRGSILWAFSSRSWLTSVDVLGDMVLAGSDDGCLRALNARTGASLWVSDVGVGPHGLRFNADPVSSVVYAYSTEDHTVYAVDAQTGENLWEFERRPGGARVVVSGDLVLFIYSADGHVQAIGKEDGQLVWDERCTGGAPERVTVAGRILCIATGRGLRGFDTADIARCASWPVSADTPEQFWSYMVWGRGGLAVRRIHEGGGLGYVIQSGSWASRDELANEIDRLCMLRDWSDAAATARGNWENPKALAEDPATLCPPEVSIRASLVDQGIRPAAQFYVQVARSATDPHDMLEYAAEALRLSPGYSDAASVKARAHKLIGARKLTATLFAEAIGHYTETINIDPTDGGAYNDRGFAYFTTGDYPKATDDFGKAIELAPRLATAYCNRANVECVLGQYDAAQADCEAALALDRKDAPTLAVSSVLYGLLGQHRRALDALDRAARTYTDAVLRRDVVTQEYHIYLPKSPDPLVLLDLSLALLCEGMAESSRASAHFNAYLEAEPNGAYAPEARRRIEALRDR